MKGYVKMNREVFLNDPTVTRDTEHTAAWVWIVCNAAWAEQKAFSGGHIVILQPGEMLMSRNALMKAIGCTERRARTILGRFLASGLVEIRPTFDRQSSKLTICNYLEIYGLANEAGSKPSNDRPTLYKEEEKKKEEEYSTFRQPLVVPSQSKVRSDIRQAFDAYNAAAERCGLAKAHKLTRDRERAIKSRLDDYGIDGWNQALANLERSSFLTGTNDRNWKASLDFICQAKSFSRLHDGGYGNGRHANSDLTAGQLSPQMEAEIRRKIGDDLFNQTMQGEP